MKSRLSPLLLLLALFTLGLVGCASTNNSGVMNAPTDQMETNAVARLHVGDTVTVVYSGLPPEGAIEPHEEPIKEDGTITLPDIGHVKAAGKTSGELQDIIHNLYVPSLYRHLTITVKTTGQRVYYVRGEVKAPGRQEYVGQITVTKAITSVGDFTDYANRHKVWLTRSNGQRFKLDCVAILDGEQPDPPVFPGDQIEVTRRLF